MGRLYVIWQRLNYNILNTQLSISILQLLGLKFKTLDLMTNKLAELIDNRILHCEYNLLFGLAENFQFVCCRLSLIRCTIANFQEPERLTQLREQPRSRNQTNKSPSEMLTDAQQAPDSDVRHKNKASDRLVIDTSRTHIQPSAGKTRGDTSSSMLKRTAEVLSAEPRRKKSVTISPHQSPPFAASPPFDIRNIISSTQMSGKTVNENKLKTSVKTKNLLKRFALPGESQTPSNRKKKENHSNTPATNPLNSISRIIGLSKICEITDDDLELD